MSNDLAVAGHLLTLPEAANELRSGHMLLIYNETSQSDAILCLPAQFAVSKDISFFTSITQNSTYVVLGGNRLDALYINLDHKSNTPFSRMVSASSVGVHSAMLNGHAAHNHAVTIRALVDPTTRPEDIIQPGEVLLVRAHPGGIVKRRDYPEAALDLMRIAGLEPGAVLCPLMLPVGDTTSHLEMAKQWGIGALSIEALLRYRLEHRVSFISETRLPTAEATFRLRHFQEIATGESYLALILGDIHNDTLPPPLLRLHSACATGDIFGSQRCDCQAQLHSALHQIAQEGRGVLLYLPQEGRGIGLSGKLQAYVLQEQGYDTLEANERLGYPIDARDYTCALEVLRELGITRARLMTNNPEKSHALQKGNIAVECISLETQPTPNNLRYLQTKQQRLGHTLSSIFTPAITHQQRPSPPPSAASPPRSRSAKPP